MMGKSTSNWLSIGMIGIAVVIAAFVALQPLDDYARESDFFTYRLALNVHHGHGLVYNAGQQALLTVAPLGVLPFSINPHHAENIAVFLFFGGIALSGVALFLLLQNNINNSRDFALVLCIIILSYPTWVGMRSAEMLAFAGIVFAFVLIDRQKTTFAGIIAGMAALIHPSGLIGVFIIGIYSFTSGKSRSYWTFALLPITVWILIALLSYGFHGFDALLLRPSPPAAALQDWLWLGIFALGIFSMIRAQVDRRLFIFPLWASLQLLFAILFTGTFSQLDCIALSATIAIGALGLIQQFSERAKTPLTITTLVVLGSLLIIAPPQSSQAIKDDLAFASTMDIPSDASLLHNRTSALSYALDDFRGNVYRLDGSYQPEVAAFVERGDYQSLIAATAPGYIYVVDASLPVDLENQNLAALNYQHVTTDENLWQRNAAVGALPETSTPIDLAFSPDVHLIGYALDRSRINSNDTVRVRLDWSLNRYPDEGIGVNINLNDINGTPISSIFTEFPAENWQTDHLSTVHSLQLPGDSPAGLLQIQVTLDYRAGILDRYTFGGIIVPLPQPDTVENRIGTLSSVNVYLPEIRAENGQLLLDLVWQTTARLEENYRIFIHVTAQDELQPLAQDDGLPLGGRYPAPYWLQDEFVSETRAVDISTLPAGDYNVNIGLYTPESGRLRNESGDYLQAANLTIESDGTVTIHSD